MRKNYTVLLNPSEAFCSFKYTKLVALIIDVTTQPLGSRVTSNSGLNPLPDASPQRKFLLVLSVVILLDATD